VGQSPNWAVKVPLVNGHMYSFASIECEVDGLLFAGFASITYDDPVKPGKLYGTGGVLVGRTPGTSKPTLSMTMYRREWDYLRAQLSGTGPSDGATVGTGSYGTKSFTVRVTYHEDALPGAGAGAGGQPIQIGLPITEAVAGPAPPSKFDAGATPESQTVTDVIERVRIVGASQSNVVGEAGSTVVLTCDPWLIRWGSGDGRDGVTNLAEDAGVGVAGKNPSGQGAGKEGPEPQVGGSQVGAGSGEFWYATDDGFEGTDYPTNPWDGFIIAGVQLPGLCKVSAAPIRVIDKQKPNGADASPLIDRGYGQANIEVQVTLWMPNHWVLWQNFCRTFWKHPNKASTFEKPALKTKPPNDPLTGKPKTDSNGQPPVIQDPAVKRERAAIDRAIPNTRDEAQGIYHPSLGPLGIGAAIISSISVPEPGPEPQTFVVKMKLEEYVWAPPESQSKGSAKKIQGAATGVKVTPPLVLAPGQKQSLPYSPVPANSPAITPDMTESSPNASFQPP